LSFQLDTSRFLNISPHVLQEHNYCHLYDDDSSFRFRLFDRIIFTGIITTICYYRAVRLCAFVAHCFTLSPASRDLIPSCGITYLCSKAFFTVRN
jgi:hypothetical protein